MPDLIIKPSATSGNKLILQDQSGSAILTTGDSGGANMHLNSSSTFPSGHVTNVFKFKDTSTATVNIQSSDTIVAGVFSFSAISGRHYIVTGSQFMAPYRYGGTHNRRWQWNGLRYGTTSRTSLDNLGGSPSDTLLYFETMGDYIHENTAAEASRHGTFPYTGSFTASSTATHYVYTTISSYGSDDRARAYSSADNPHNCIIMEVMP